MCSSDLPPEDSEEIDVGGLDNNETPCSGEGDIEDLPILNKDTTIAVEGDSERRVHIRSGDGPYNLRRRVVGKRDPSAVYFNDG